MNNHDAAQKIKDLGAVERGQLKKNLYGLIFKSLAAIAVLGAVGVYFTAGGAGDDTARYQSDGVVSKALVVAMDEGNKVRVVHNPQSAIPFASITDSAQIDALPVPTASEATGTVIMTTDGFTHVKVGDVFPVVNTPYEPGYPRTFESLTAEPSNTYLIWVALLAALALVLWGVGVKAAKR